MEKAGVKKIFRVPLEIWFPDHVGLQLCKELHVSVAWELALNVGFTRNPLCIMRIKWGRGDICLPRKLWFGFDRHFWTLPAKGTHSSFPGPRTLWVWPWPAGHGVCAPNEWLSPSCRIKGSSCKGERWITLSEPDSHKTEGKLFVTIDQEVNPLDCSPNASKSFITLLSFLLFCTSAHWQCFQPLYSVSPNSLQNRKSALDSKFAIKTCSKPFSLCNPPSESKQAAVAPVGKP